MKGGLATWEFGPPGEFRDFIVTEILAGRKRGTTNLRVAHRMDGFVIPRVGEARVLVDSTGAPAAVVRFVGVDVTTSAAVTKEIALRESESVDQWRKVHREYWESIVPKIREFLGDPQWTLSEDEEAVSLAFEVIDVGAPGPLNRRAP